MCFALRCTFCSPRQKKKKGSFSPQWRKLPFLCYMLRLDLSRGDSAILSIFISLYTRHADTPTKSFSALFCTNTTESYREVGRSSARICLWRVYDQSRCCKKRRPSMLCSTVPREMVSLFHRNDRSVASCFVFQTELGGCFSDISDEIPIESTDRIISDTFGDFLNAVGCLPKQ